MNEELIAPCGMNCALCSAYLARQHDLRSQGIMRNYCAGCRPRGKNCAFLKKKCDLLGKGQVKYCYECPDFPCRTLKHLDKRYRTNYRMSMIENLEYIREHGIEKFLKKEEEKYGRRQGNDALRILPCLLPYFPLRPLLSLVDN